MAYYSQLKQSVKNVIKQNGQQEITGDVLQSVLISIITNLGTHAQFSGIASLDGNPGTPDGNEFYLAVKPGTYTNFNGITVTKSDGLSILVNMDGTWKKLTTGTAMKTDITTLQGTINSLSSTLQTVKSDLDTAEKSITSLQASVTNINTKITAAKNLIQRINAYIEETAAVNLGITYQNLLSGVQNGDIKALIDSNGSLYGVIVIDGTLYAYCQLTNGDGAYLLAGASYILTDAGSGNIKIESAGTEIKLPYLDGNNKIPELMLPDDINTLKSKARYEYSLSKIFALASYSESEDIEEAFTPTYAPDGNTAMRLPQSGDLLEATNGATSVVLKGTSSAFSFFYGDNRRDITLSGSAGNYKVAVVVTPLGVRVFDLDKLNALTDESTPENIEEAFRGNYPTAGDLLRGADESSWVIMSGSETSTLAKTFTYHTSGKLRTLTVSGGQGNETIKVEEKEVESSDVVRLSAALEEGQSVDIGMTFSELKEKNPTFIVDANKLLFYCAYMDASSGVFTTIPPVENDKNSIVFSKGIVITDAGSGKVNISVTEYSYIVPQLGSDGKLPVEVMPDSAKELLFRDLWNTAGGKYNAETGYYELNGLTDINYGQALTIYNAGAFRPVANVEFRQYSLNRQIKTNIPYAQSWYTQFYMPICMRYMFASCVLLEAVRFSNAEDGGSMVILATGSGESMFSECNKLVKVFEILDFSKVTDLTRTFTGCTSLTTIRIRNLRRHLYIGDSPNLSKDSILYLIQNSAATEAITVTLHPTAYAMAIADTDIQNALQQKTFVSLAQAETA